MKRILPDIHLLKLGAVNAYLVDHGGLTLIDTGYPGSTDKIVAYLKRMGRRPEDLENIIITHLHPDHTGSLADLQDRSSATTYVHEADAPFVEIGNGFRESYRITPGLAHKLVFNFFVKPVSPKMPPARIDRRLTDADSRLPIGKGFDLIPIPGHAQGQIALRYYDHGKVLFAADALGNMMGMAPAPFYEDYEQGIQDLQTLANYDFDSMVFGHGKPIVGRADQKFRRRFRKRMQVVS